MALAAFAAILPIALVGNGLLGPTMSAPPLLARVLILAMLFSTLMTYRMMPTVTSRLRRWLLLAGSALTRARRELNAVVPRQCRRRTRSTALAAPDYRAYISAKAYQECWSGRPDAGPRTQKGSLRDPLTDDRLGRFTRPPR